MKLSNPFIPSLVPSTNPARVRTTVLVTLASQAALMAVLLIEGCKPSVQAPANSPTDLTSLTATTSTNALVADVFSTNVAASSTNLAAGATISNSLDLASTNVSLAAPILPPLDTNVSAPAKGGTYTVVSGDSYSKIAKLNHITVRALKEANPDVNPHKLKVGQNLNLPDGSEADYTAAAVPALASTPSVSTASEPAGASIPASSASAQDGIYVVKSGDTLFRIARTQHTTVKELRLINNLSSDKIMLGQKLKIAAGGNQS